MTVGQGAFGSLLLVCVLVLPHVVLKRNEAGLSNYGIHDREGIPLN